MLSFVLFAAAEAQGKKHAMGQHLSRSTRDPPWLYQQGKKQWLWGIWGTDLHASATTTATPAQQGIDEGTASCVLGCSRSGVQQLTFERHSHSQLRIGKSAGGRS